MQTILLIEDTSDILGNLTEYLEMEGYKVIVATNGKRGVEIAAESLPDIIVCDVLMPEMDGYGVLQVLKQCPKTSEIPFIFSTSLSEKIDISDAYKLGADDYLVKPFDPITLLEKVRTQLNKVSK